MTENSSNPICFSKATQYSSENLSVEKGALFNKLIWLDSKDAARFLRVSVGSLRNMVYRRQIVARKFRRKLYFKASELNRLIEDSLLCHQRR